MKNIKQLLTLYLFGFLFSCGSNTEAEVSPENKAIVDAIELGYMSLVVGNDPDKNQFYKPVSIDVGAFYLAALIKGTEKSVHLEPRQIKIEKNDGKTAVVKYQLFLMSNNIEKDSTTITMTLKNIADKWRLDGSVLLGDLFEEDNEFTKEELHDAATNTTGLTPTPPINAQQDLPPAVPNRPTTSVAFAQELHDFGDIKQETTNKIVFEFTNTGVEPLVIENATGSCGCTVPNYPKEPIMPGQKGVIEVEYKPGQQEGPQQKTVTVTANTEPRQTILKIKANVVK